MNAIEVVDLAAGYRNEPVTQGITFVAESGQWISVLGDADAGKTTLLSALAGRIAPISGVVRIYSKPPRSVGRLIGYVSAESHRAPLLTVHQAVSFAASRSDVPPAARAARIAETLDAVGLYEDRERAPGTLGQTGRIALRIATALVHRPPVLIMDNVLTALPPGTVDRLLEYLDDRRRDDGLTVIHATTRSEEAERADRVLMLDHGRPIALDHPDCLLASHAGDRIVVEAADPEETIRTLRGIYDVQVVETRDAVTFTATDGESIAAQLFRHPSGGLRAIHLRRPDLWDVYLSLCRNA